MCVKIYDIRTRKMTDPMRLVQFHDQLNPALWEGQVLRPDVAGRLKKIAAEFIKFLEIPDFPVMDMLLVGSNTGYAWTELSDIDLHLLVDMTAISRTDALAPMLIQSKKKLWNDNHHITIRGIPVEMYVQDHQEPFERAGEYSLLRRRWLKHPRKVKPTVNDRAVVAKVERLIRLIRRACPCRDAKRIERLKEKLRRWRRIGLQTHGEFRVENLRFKIIRNLGYMDELRQCYRKAVDARLSLN